MILQVKEGLDLSFLNAGGWQYFIHSNKKEVIPQYLRQSGQEE